MEPLTNEESVNGEDSAAPTPSAARIFTGPGPDKVEDDDDWED